MTFVVSDIHGCYDKFLNLLERMRFGDADTLYMLGDAVDRGADGIRALRDLMGRKNAVMLRGNHDDTALKLLYLLRQDAGRCDPKELQELYALWFSDGGEPTYRAFLALPEAEQNEVLAFLNRLPVARELEVNGQRFWLSHTLPRKKRFLDPAPLRTSDLISGSPDYDEVYDPERIFVTGHTPTDLIDEASRGRIWKGNNHIAIDCGAAYGGPLGCVCLETGREYYEEKKKKEVKTQ